MARLPFRVFSTAWAMLVLGTSIVASAQETFLLPPQLGAECQCRLPACSPDGRLLAGVASERPGGQQAIVVWEISTRRVVTTLPLEGDDCSCLAFAPDSRALASGHHSGQLRLWNVTDWHSTAMKPGSDRLQGDVQRLAFSPDGRWLAASNLYGERRVRIFDVRDAREQAVLETGGFTHALRFLADGKSLAMAVEIHGKLSRRAPSPCRCEVQIWDVDRFKRRETLQGFASWTRDAQGRVAPKAGLAGSGCEMNLSPDGTLLAITHIDQIALWKVSTREAIHVGTHGFAVHTLEFSPDSRTLATLADGTGTPEDSGAVCLWDTATGQLRRTLKYPPVPPAWVYGIAFSADGKYLATTAHHRGFSNPVGLSANPSASASDLSGVAVCRWNLADPNQTSSPSTAK